jgi:hypothetical protein
MSLRYYPDKDTWSTLAPVAKAPRLLRRRGPTTPHSRQGKRHDKYGKTTVRRGIKPVRCPLVLAARIHLARARLPREVSSDPG